METEMTEEQALELTAADEGLAAMSSGYFDRAEMVGVRGTAVADRVAWIEILRETWPEWVAFKAATVRRDAAWAVLNEELAESEAAERAVIDEGIEDGNRCSKCEQLIDW